MTIDVRVVDYHNKEQSKALIELLDGYARDPMGGGNGLSEAVKANLPIELARRSDIFSVIAYVDGQPAGLINCLETFSTFKCKPLVNIHDVVVSSDYRGQGLSQKMLVKVEQVAREKGCCKLTLEVLQGNEIAKNAYIKFGFADYELDPAIGKAMFWEKTL